MQSLTVAIRTTVATATFSSTANNSMAYRFSAYEQIILSLSINSIGNESVPIQFTEFTETTTVLKIVMV